MSKKPVLRLLSGFSFLVLFVAALILFAGAPQGAMAQSDRGGMPGDFDYYVLALSWSPTFCSGQGRGDGGGRGGSDGAYGEDAGAADTATATAAVDTMAGATAVARDMAGGIPMSNAAE